MTTLHKGVKLEIGFPVSVEIELPKKGGVEQPPQILTGFIDDFKEVKSKKTGKVIALQIFVKLPSGEVREVDADSIKPSATGDTETRFKLLANNYEFALKGIFPALTVSGNPALGKSHILEQTLDNMGLPTYSQILDAGDSGIEMYGIRITKGKITPTALYKCLYAAKEKGSVAIFDDCDSALRNKESVMMLKAAFDSTATRTVSWDSPFIKKMGLPTSFTFEGSVIFITNSPLNELDEAVKSRCVVSDVFLAGAEYRRRFYTLAPIIAANKQVSPQIASQVVEVFRQFDSSFKDNAPLMRLFANSCKIIAEMIAMGCEQELIKAQLANMCAPYFLMK